MTTAARRRLWAALAAACMCSSAPAPTPSDAALIGEPAAGVQRRHFRLESELDAAWRDVELGGACCLDSTALRLTIKMAGRVHDRVELFGRLGGVLVHALDAPAGPGLDGSADVAIGGGLKVTLHEQGAVAWGVGAQTLFHEAEDRRLGVRISWHEVDLFAGPSVAVTPEARLYGGLLGSLIAGELRGPGGSARLDARRAAGIFLGGQAAVTRAALFGVELRLLDELAVASRIGITF
ncbi:MAG: hypothetical protein AB1515_02835 [Nitrospirota bacterium]